MNRVERAQGRRADATGELTDGVIKLHERQFGKNGLDPFGHALAPRHPPHLDVAHHACRLFRPLLELDEQRLRLRLLTDELDESEGIEVQQLRQALDLVLAQLLQDLRERTGSGRGRRRRTEVSQIAPADPGDPTFGEEARDDAPGGGRKRDQQRHGGAALDPPQPLRKVLA